MNTIDVQDTKIVATIGPASNNLEMLLALVREGVDVFRLNFSHGKHEDHAKVIDLIHYINKTYKVHIGILADLQGPKLRIGEVEEGVELVEGEDIIFTNEEVLGNADRVYMNYDRFAKDVAVGDKVLVNDGKIQLEVLETDGEGQVRMRVLFGGPLSSRKGVNLPDTKLALPPLTEKDERDLAFILTQKVNWIALSFVRTASEVQDLKGRIAQAGHAAKVISKIEKPQAVANIKAIIKASDAIMIARGDLGIEVPIERLPAIQKNIIKGCLRHARPVIVATQMMESMIENPSPTRAEVTDVANAVLDGADAVMLSGETAVGRHPDLVVKAMNKIIYEAEQNYHLSLTPKSARPVKATYYSDIVCFQAAAMSDEIGAEAIIGMTASGYTAFKISCCRPKSKIYIFSQSREILSTLNLVWGVRCFFYDKFTTTDETMKDVNRILRNRDLVKSGDMVVNTGSMPIHARGRTNMVKITRID